MNEILKQTIAQAKEYKKKPPLSKEESIKTLNTIVKNPELLEFLRKTGIIQALIAGSIQESNLTQEEAVAVFEENYPAPDSSS